MKRWYTSRPALGGLALASAGLVGVFVVQLGGSSWHGHGATVYFLAAFLASVSPAAIAVQVVVGQVLVGSLLVGPDGPPALLLTPAAAGVIVTAELLSIMARTDTPFESHPRNDLRRAVVSALIGGGVFGAVSAVSGFPGPTGLMAVILASGASVGLATLLTRDAM